MLARLHLVKSNVRLSLHKTPSKPHTTYRKTSLSLSDIENDIKMFTKLSYSLKGNPFLKSTLSLIMLLLTQTKYVLFVQSKPLERKATIHIDIYTTLLAAYS